ncbi:hypothetical protein OIV83_002301 [Microbotryomycetes sp. JL201]|nr:hypothetical protein OIV83_002301 [Microbotryomycetes sp. JL201]
MPYTLRFRNPPKQEALLLHAPKSRYELTEIPLPSLNSPDEVLIRIEAIGLNPVDWKSADFGFGLPTLPALCGRDYAGTIVKVGSRVQRWQPGDRVFGPSTAYRDYRTSAFQQYAVASEHCLGTVPDDVSVEQCAALGVGAVAAALVLGSALGIAIRGFAPRTWAIGAEGESPEWIKLSGTDSPISTPQVHLGEYLLIWGGSTVTGFLIAQLAHIAGLRVIAVADKSKHDARLRALGISHIVDRSDPKLAVQQVRDITQGQLRYAVDCVGRQTAEFAMQTLSDLEREVFLVGLSGLPGQSPRNVRLCDVPIKTFHTNAAVGNGLMRLLEDLIASKELVLPPIEIVGGGLEAVNGALDRMRSGNHSFGRLVVKMGNAS